MASIEELLADMKVSIDRENELKEKLTDWMRTKTSRQQDLSREFTDRKRNCGVSKQAKINRERQYRMEALNALLNNEEALIRLEMELNSGYLKEIAAALGIHDVVTVSSTEHVKTIIALKKLEHNLADWPSKVYADIGLPAERRDAMTTLADQAGVHIDWISDIAALLDPATFSDAVVQIYLEHTGDLEQIAKSLESSHLNFSRYGDTFFEVVFTGARTQPGTVKPDEGECHPYSIIHCEPKRDAILPSVIYMQKILRRRPFLIKSLENVMRRFLQSLELFEEDEGKNLAIFTALAFSQKLSGLPPETVFQPLLKDNLVAKGLVLSFITDFFKEYLVDNTLDDLISVLKRGKMEDNLLDFFPSTKRTPEALSEHFTKEGLVLLVDYHEKKIFEVKLKEMKTAVKSQIAEEADISDVIEIVKQHVKDGKFPDTEVVRILWDVLMDAVPWSGKNQKQNANSVLRQVKTWAELLNAFCTTGKLELEIMYKVQVQCYEDAKLMKLFPKVIRSLYDQDIVTEDTILHWFHKGTNLKGRQSFVKALGPFVKWLEAEEEE